MERLLTSPPVWQAHPEPRQRAPPRQAGRRVPRKAAVAGLGLAPLQEPRQALLRVDLDRPRRPALES